MTSIESGMRFIHPGEILREAIKQIVAGNYDVDLCAGVFKQRVARPGEGQSGGYRVINECATHRTLTTSFFVISMSAAKRNLKIFPIVIAQLMEIPRFDRNDLMVVFSRSEAEQSPLLPRREALLSLLAQRPQPIQ